MVTMQVSAEIRLFWTGREPEMLGPWFLDESVHGCAAGGGLRRSDIYMRDADQTELGVKQRGSKPGVEVKGLVEALPSPVSFSGEEVTIEIWSKWSSTLLKLEKPLSITLQKRRWLRKFNSSEGSPVEVPLNASELPVTGGALPRTGCNVEWTIIELSGKELAWTLGFESFGCLQTVEGSLRAVLRLMNERKPPRTAGAFKGGYPAWLSRNPPES